MGIKALCDGRDESKPSAGGRMDELNKMEAGKELKECHSTLGGHGFFFQFDKHWDCGGLMDNTKSKSGMVHAYDAEWLLSSSFRLS